MSNNMLDRAMLARRAGNVQRYHTQTLLRPESVAQHTFNMLNLLRIITGGQVSKRLMEAVLVHDMGEYITGDIPSPGKRALNQEARESFEGMEDVAMRGIHPAIDVDLTEYEKALLKLVDMLDGLMKCTEERMLGNKTIRICAGNYISYLESKGWGPTADEVIKAAIEEFRRHD